MQRHDTATASALRSIGTTDDSPQPPLVCAAGFPETEAARFVEALTKLHRSGAARMQLDALGIRRFAAITRADYLPLAELDREARAASYPLPA